MYLIFFLLWVIFNSKITIEIIIFGIVLSGGLGLFISKIMGINLVSLRTLTKNIFYGVVYIFVLVIEIIKANIQIIRVVLSPSTNLEPQLVYFSTDLKYKWSRVLLANSITLTPGTLTISLEENQYCVHAMDKNMAEGIEDSIFIRLLLKMEAVGLPNQGNLNSKVEV